MLVLLNTYLLVLLNTYAGTIKSTVAIYCDESTDILDQLRLAHCTIYHFLHEENVQNT